MKLLKQETEDLTPLVLPPGWERTSLAENAIINHRKGLSIIWSVEDHSGKRWVHVSIAGKDVLPSYNELCVVKRWFIGREKKAIQIFPQESEHVNIHDRCLHLWHCLDDDGLPDFRRPGGL